MFDAEQDRRALAVLNGPLTEREKMLVDAARRLSLREAADWLWAAGLRTEAAGARNGLSAEHIGGRAAAYRLASVELNSRSADIVIEQRGAAA